MSESSVAANKAALARILIAYGLNDVAPLLAALHEDVVWVSNGPEQLFRFGGKHVGRNNAVAGLSLMATDYTLHSYQILEMVGEGDVVWAQVRLETTRRNDGTRLTVNVANRWQFREGRIIGIDEYYDSASLLMREGRLITATG